MPTLLVLPPDEPGVLAAYRSSCTAAAANHRLATLTGGKLLENNHGLFLLVMCFRCSTALLSSRGISILTVRITHHTDSVNQIAGFFMNGRGSYFVEQTYIGSYRSLPGKRRPAYLLGKLSATTYGRSINMCPSNHDAD